VSDDMLPPVPEVVLIQKALPWSEREVGETDAGGIIRKGDAAEVGGAERLAVDHELMEVGVAPAHRDLEHVVQVGDGGVAADEQSAGDHRTDLPQPDVALGG